MPRIFARQAGESSLERGLDPGGTAKLAVLGGNLPPSGTHQPRRKSHAGVVRSTAGRVARQDGPVARSTRTIITCSAAHDRVSAGDARKPRRLRHPARIRDSHPGVRVEWINPVRVCLSLKPMMNNVFFRHPLLAALVVAGVALPAGAADNAKPATASGTTTNAPKPAHTRGFGREIALKEMEKMAVAEGLEATLFAAEPMLVNPCDMDVDSRGRVWITEGANYRRWSKPPVRPEGDRIVILEDTDGDGTADKQTVFYQGLDVNAALGICVLGNKVIVSCSPNVLVLTDEDGDGKCDKKEVLFTGIRGTQHDHAVHAFVFGPDGKLYFNFGNEGHAIKDRDGKPVIDLEGNEVSAKGKPYRQGMVFRCNPDGTEFEVLGHNFRNNYEVAVDSFGTLWQSDNDDDGNKGVRINYVMEHGNFGYTDEIKGSGWGEGWKRAQGRGAAEAEKVFYEWHQYDPGVVPNLLHTGAGSPTGIAVYEGKLLPKVFQNQVIHCDAGPRVVRAYPVENSGAGYTATMSNVLASADGWYRPSDVCVAPDGSLLIADWNDPGVGGHAAGDHDLGIMRGRVYRVAPKGLKYTVPKLDLKTAAGAVAALQSPNHETRYRAWTALNAMGRGAQNDLSKLAAPGNEPRMRARALHLLARIPGNARATIDTAVRDGDADIRVVGLRMARQLQAGQVDVALNQPRASADGSKIVANLGVGMRRPAAVVSVLEVVKKLVNDPSAQVRRECAIALRHNSSAEAPALWSLLAQQHDGKDRWYLEALGIGADKQQEQFFGAWLAQVGDRWNTPAGRDIVWRSRSAKSAALLAKLITAKDATPKDKDRYFRALDFLNGPEKEQALTEIATGGL
jgi:putative membrane-bound dehydrogenase-like protein